MRLLLTGAFKYTDEQLNKIQALGYEIVFVQDERQKLRETLATLDLSTIEAVVCNGLFLYNDITQFTNLKFIQLTSAGLDRVPLDYINSHGIRLASARGVYSAPMAEWVVLKILEIYKKTRLFYEAQQSHTWVKQRELLELSGKTAAIIGFGNVGVAIAKRLKAFDVAIIGVGGRTIHPSEAALADELYLPSDLDSALSKSDIVILTLPLTHQTHHLMNQARFAKMKDGSTLINVSRGGVIDETALVEALRLGKFLGVALDVFEEEPLPPDSALWDFENVIITPHNAFVSDKVNDRLFEIIVRNLKNAFSKN